MKILVADDDNNLRHMITTMLREEGHEVIEARDGRQAFSKIMEMTLDAVITDMRMPPESGLTVLQAMWRSDPTPAYVHSSENTFRDRGGENNLEDLQTQIPEIFDFAEFHLKNNDRREILKSIKTFVRKCEEKKATAT